MSKRVAGRKLLPMFVPSLFTKQSVLAGVWDFNLEEHKVQAYHVFASAKVENWTPACDGQAELFLSKTFI